MATNLRFLRPYSCHPLPAGSSPRSSAYLRFYELSRTAGGAVSCRREKSTLEKSPEEVRARDPKQKNKSTSPKTAQDVDDYKPEQRGALVAARIKELGPAGGLEYPRYRQARSMRVAHFNKEFKGWGTKKLEHQLGLYTISGRILHVRRFGSKFFFVQLVEDGQELQVMLNFGKLQDETDLADFRKLAAILKRGDHISVTGRPALTDSQELSLDARHLPKLLAPSIAPLPFQIPEEARMQQRHLDLLVNKSARDILVARSFIINHLRAHLAKVLQCVEVQTPILAANAGGASARPFATRATEFSHKEMALRIAPELWLKRLVVAGFDRVFELGPAFRNEGVDHTHNPEFTVCEFYLAHANLDALMNITQNMFYGLAKSVQSLIHKGVVRLDSPDQSVFESRFERVEFIPELQEALGHPLPDLDSPTAVADLIKLLDDAGKDWHLSLPPGNPSLPKLLDHIAGAVLEPRSMGRPLYITHHPVCMSPLAKSFTCPQTGQQVAARAELFFDGNELANMYEEENDPFKQRRKLVGQARARLSGEKGTPAADNDEEPPHVVDEQYISVLESGLPPTGGWGCGVDRLVMLFTGAKRISDVLPFGNLRNVVGLASAGPQSQPQPQESVAVDRARALVRESRKGPWNERTAAAKLDGAAPAARKVPAKSAFEAFSAASFLDMGREAAPPATHSGVSASQGGVVRRSAPKIIEEDETIARGPGSGDPELTSLVAEMAGVEAEMEKTASGAKEAWEKTTAAEDAASALKKDGN